MSYAIRTIHDYVTAVSQAIHENNGAGLARLFEVADGHVAHVAAVSLGLDVIRVRILLVVIPHAEASRRTRAR